MGYDRHVGGFLGTHPDVDGLAIKKAFWLWRGLNRVMVLCHEHICVPNQKGDRHTDGAYFRVFFIISLASVLHPTFCANIWEAVSVNSFLSTTDQGKGGILIGSKGCVRKQRKSKTGIRSQAKIYT